MKITYNFADGESTTVEVNEELGTIILDSRREEHALEERERYHSLYSFDGAEYEGDDIEDIATPEWEMLKMVDDKVLYEALNQLTEVQRRRLEMLADGLTVREIAVLEGAKKTAIQESIDASRKKIRKFFKKHPDKTASFSAYYEGTHNPPFGKDD